MSGPDALVRAMCRSWSDPDPDRIAAFFAEDAVYHNIPMEPIAGRAAIRDFIAGFLTTFDAIDFEIHHQVVAGEIVMNERTDTLRGNGRDTPLPVMGVFEVRDGEIAAWRDYFDMAAINRAFGLSG
ncbi:nuclear transport factor 2 family protein [Nocardia puris]|uniref:Limonene-1,2-epoxide hydrolase n=1 Tax=Nocardia puris TaxID=208602 RepID=A0A366E4P4_9NOCA|nr:nuclear transport factor 2 family protein [Nocardia puris]MBF6214387.1 nuclear transport factor 2 family protein [Nocardia puris]MBF6369002.1 nuclear transport factor 2 family protein [Nocardia puris]MBF6462850.1 nuclear transport factor 2 family protein [Nocardia puris]RBO96769.1 limonene-1,2-epoxide hydrolase [Nocardia puris]